MEALLHVTFWLIAFLLVASFLLFHNDRAQVQRRAGNVRNSLRRHTGKHRIAVVIPLAGEELPPYLSLFCQAARGSASLVDFVILHTGVLESYTQPLPENVHFINLQSTRGLAERLVRVASNSDNNESLTNILTQHIQHYPYVLVEFKPALGFIFQEELKGYSHWAYSDIDIAFGDLPRWITEEELTDFDLVTYGFGDQDRVYLRGQFTIHKNNEKVNQLWRGCDYLSKIEERYEKAASGKEKIHFESAEGCYSVAVMQRTDIRIKYAVKAFTDVDTKDTAYKHGLYIGIGQHRDRSVIYKATSVYEGHGLISLSPTWFESKHNIYANMTNPMQTEIGDKVEIQRNIDKNVKCMYWVQEKYKSELCLQGVLATDTVFWINGKLYKQSYTNAELPGSIISAPFFHFQEWKRYFRSNQLTTMDRSLHSLTWILTKEGTIPAHQSHASGRNRGALSPLGVQPLPLRWRGVKQAIRNQLPHHSYCLRSGPRKFPPVPSAPGCERTISWHDQSRIEILNGALGWKHVNIYEDVTLALTLQITSKQALNQKALNAMLDLTISNINAWEGQPCVLVIHISGASVEAVDTIRERMSVTSDICLVAIIVYDNSGLVSRKALMNMAGDAAPTRWVVSGVEIERGIILSSEAALLTHRRAKILDVDSSANVLIIPQFGISDEGEIGTSLSISELKKIRDAGTPNIKDLVEFEKGSCEVDLDNPNAIFSPVHKLWWRLTTSEIARTIPEDIDSMSEMAASLEMIQTSFATLMTSEMLDNLSLVDLSPILMVDNLGPQKSTRTASLVREVEEFGGKQCYNILRLAQLAVLGYNISVLPGAFATSSYSSRKVAMENLNEDALGASRCDACFMFDNAHENILEAVVHDEQIRPAKTAVLWGELTAQPGMSRSNGQ